MQDMSAFPRVELDREPKGDFLGLPLRLREGFRILSSVQLLSRVDSLLPHGRHHARLP